MTKVAVGVPGGQRLRSRLPLAALGLGAAALVLLVPMAGAESPSWVGGESGTSWSNGIVLCEFAPAAPSAGISAVDRTGTGLSSAVTEAAEVDASGSVIAVADLATVAWSTTNRSTEDSYDLEYNVSAPVSRTLDANSSVGIAKLRVDYLLPVYASSTNQTNAVTLVILVAGWPWQGGGDHLVVMFAAWATYPENEALEFGAPPLPVVTGVSTQSGATLDSIGMPTFATATSAAGSPVNVSATPRAGGTASSANLTVVFGSQGGSFSSLEYSAQVQVVLPSSVAGIPVSYLLAVGGAAALISVLAAVGAWRVRRRKSSLTYVEEEQ